MLELVVRPLQMEPSSFNTVPIPFDLGEFSDAFFSARIVQDGARRTKMFSFNDLRFVFTSTYGNRTGWSGWRDEANNISVNI